MSFENTVDFAKDLDRKDPLSAFRDSFFIPQNNGAEISYFCGHSLGLQPKSAEKYIQQELRDWAEKGVKGHFNAAHPWVDYHKLFEAPLAKITGAKEHEVVAMNSLSVNLHLMFTTFYRPDRKRWKVIMEADAFSSDMYAVESQCLLHGLDPKKAIIEVRPCEGEELYCTDDVLSALQKHGNETAMLFLGGVNYFSGQVVDMEKVTKEAHKMGVVTGLDLAHAVGNIPLRLHDWGVDFAVWCSYKYLNSGPGGTGGAFIHEKHSLNEELPRLAGWWGHNEKERFLMKKGFLPERGASGWQLSNASVFSLAVQLASLHIFDQVGMGAIREKSVQLTGFLEFLLKSCKSTISDPWSITLLTPAVPEERGAQLSLKVKERGKELLELLERNNILADFRSPDVIRFAPAPLYNSYYEVWRLGQVLGKYCIYEE